MSIAFSKPNVTGKELHNIAAAYFGRTLGEGGDFSTRCEDLLRQLFPASRAAILTSSIGTGFELAADLLTIKPGDEVILPSFTSVVSANAFARRGAVLRFADVERQGLNLGRAEVAALIGERTRAIIVPHYAGVAADIVGISEAARRAGSVLIEDLTQAFLVSCEDRLLGSIGALTCASFHESEGIHAGEGGALILNDERFVYDAEILKFRGTRKAAFARGESVHYGWEKVGGEYCANELTSAFLYAQLEQAQATKDAMRQIWQSYLDLCRQLDQRGILETPPSSGAGNFYLILPEAVERADLIADLARLGIECRGHYYPLHLTSEGKARGRTDHVLPVAEAIHARVIRLPSYLGIRPDEQSRVIKILLRLVENKISDPRR